MTKIYVLTVKLKDIGKLDQQRKLPTKGRIAAGMKTTCDRCRKPITDEFFIVGFKSGMRNMAFHESCVDI